ncbi:Transporter of the ATP-binding cassette (ABC), partial [Linderina pennispora]
MLTFAPQLLAQLLLSVAVAVLNYSGPFFLQRILQSIEIIGNTTVDGTPAKSIRSAYLDAFGLFVFTFLNMQLIDQAMWIGRHMDFRMKGLLVGELSTKTLNRRAKGSLEGVTGDDDEDSSDDGLESAQEATNGKIMNLLTTDLNRVTKVVAYLDDLYTLPLSAVIGVIYMFKLLGWSSLIGFSI